MKVIHLGSMASIDKMGDITRHIYNMCDGEHSYYNIYDWQKLKDKPGGIYLIHHFKSPKHLNTFAELEFPKYSRIISLLHSSPPCSQHPQAVKVVTISNSQHQEWLDTGIATDMIRGATDLTPYLAIKPNYDRPVFGRISRWEPGKFHSYWNDFVKTILKKYEVSSYLMVMDKPPEGFVIDHERAVYVEGIKINEPLKKAQVLQCMNIYADAHGDFRETFNVSLLECMAAGMAPVIYEGYSGPMEELTRGCGCITTSESDFLTCLDTLVRSKEARARFGSMARERAKQYKLEEMIEEWDHLLKQIA